MKATGLINRTPLEVFKVISNDKYRKDYDANYDSGYPIERIGD